MCIFILHKSGFNRRSYRLIMVTEEQNNPFSTLQGHALRIQLKMIVS